MSEQKQERCGNCGYDLRATGRGAACPECGTYRMRVEGVVDAPMSAMEIGVIRRFVWGARILAGCMVGAIALGAGAGSVIGKGQEAWMMAGVTLLWAMGCVGLTPVIDTEQGRFRGFGSRGVIRRLARWLQFAWPMSWVFAATVRNMQGAGGGSAVAEMSLAGMTALLGATGLTGTVLLCVLMRELAQWVRDDLAEKLMLGAAWAYGLGVPLVVLAMLKLSAFVYLMVTCGAAVAMGLLMLPAGLISLCHTIELSKGHYKEKVEAEARRQERIRAHFKSMTDRLAE